MPERCVAAGCSRTPKDNVSLHTFPKQAELRRKWSKAVKANRADWSEPTGNSALCSMHFLSDCYEAETLLKESMGLPVKRRKLKGDAVPTLLPKAVDVKSGSLAWCRGSLHSPVAIPTTDSVDSSRPAFRKRKRSQIVEACLQEDDETVEPLSI